MQCRSRYGDRTKGAVGVMNMRAGLLVALLTGLACRGAGGQDALQSVANQAEAESEDAAHDLVALRQTIDAERAPLVAKLSALEARAIEARRRYDGAKRARGDAGIETGSIRGEIKVRGQEVAVIADLLDAYVRDFEMRLHISEVQIYRPMIDAAEASEHGAGAAPLPKLSAHMRVIEAAMDRIKRLAGGEVFHGRAVAGDGEAKAGSFAHVGPVAVFVSDDGATTGVVGRKSGSGQAMVVEGLRGSLAKSVGDLVRLGRGELPVGPGLCGGPKASGIRGKVIGFIDRGGPLMLPILLMALVSSLAGAWKLLQVHGIRKLDVGRVDGVFRQIGCHASGADGGLASAENLGGLAGDMLRTGFSHIGEPKERIEAIVFERVLVARRKLNGLLPVIRLCASAAPLVGLLGSVISMNEVFKRFGLAGSIDAAALWAGVSDALLTTEIGLAVAIPSLVVHALVARRVADLVQNMEAVAVAFLGWLPNHGHQHDAWRASGLVEALESHDQFPNA